MQLWSMYRNHRNIWYIGKYLHLSISTLFLYHLFLYAFVCVNIWKHFPLFLNTNLILNWNLLLISAHLAIYVKLYKFQLTTSPVVVQVLFFLFFFFSELYTTYFYYYFFLFLSLLLVMVESWCDFYLTAYKTKLYLFHSFRTSVNNRNITLLFFFCTYYVHTLCLNRRGSEKKWILLKKARQKKNEENSA